MVEIDNDIIPVKSISIDLFHCSSEQIREILDYVFDLGFVWYNAKKPHYIQIPETSRFLFFENDTFLNITHGLVNWRAHVYKKFDEDFKSDLKTLFTENSKDILQNTIHKIKIEIENAK